MDTDITKTFPKFKRPLTKKAKWYLEQHSSVNDAFNFARFEDRATLNSLYDAGVNINCDIDAPNKLNMFNWSITAHGACNPYFLELMFKYGRKDIETDGQKVFEMACAYGDTRHIEIFMSRQKEYEWDLYECMKSAVMRGNVSNLHHLLLYKQPTKEEKCELWDYECGNFSANTKMLLYMYQFWGCDTITKEKLTEIIPRHFCDVLIFFVRLYLEKNEPFTITTDIVQNILGSTDDRMIKLQYLIEKGFEVEQYDNIKNTPEEELPKPSKRRYYSYAY